MLQNAEYAHGAKGKLLTFFVFCRSYSIDLIRLNDSRSMPSFSGGIFIGLLISSVTIPSNLCNLCKHGCSESSFSSVTKASLIFENPGSTGNLYCIGFQSAALLDALSPICLANKLEDAKLLIV